MKQYDLLIVGAGPAGVFAAIEGAALGLKTLVVGEARPQDRTGEVVGPEALTALAQAGVPIDRLPGNRIYSAAIAWESEQLAYRDHLLHPAGEALAIESTSLDRFVRDLLARKGITFCHGRAAIRPGGDEWICDIASSSGRYDVSSARLVIATGRRRWPLRDMIMPMKRLDRLVAITRAYRLRDNASGFRHQSLLEASNGGWWFLAPQGRTAIAATFHTDLDLLPRAYAARVAFAEKCLAETVHARAAIAEPLSRPRIRDASTVFRRCVTATIQAAGDALHSFDPLTGFGIAKALEEGRQATLSLRGRADWSIRDAAIKADRTDYLRQRQLLYIAAAKRFDSCFWERRRHGHIGSRSQ